MNKILLQTVGNIAAVTLWVSAPIATALSLIVITLALCGGPAFSGGRVLAVAIMVMLARFVAVALIGKTLEKKDKH